MRYLSLFSGIGGFDLGLDRAGMTCAGQVEYDAAARSVLARHWPDVPRLNDIKEVQGDEFGTVAVVVGGFPCQDVSVAGRREGLAGERSGLWFDFHRIIDRVRPGWVVIENVPGLLSSNGGRDFAIILRGLVECGYGVAWRILDAQYFGVPQRRRRVFIVGHLGSGRAAEVLFESEGGGGDIAEGRKAGQIAPAISSKWAKGTGGPSGDECQNLVTHTLTSGGHDAGEDGTGRGVPLVTTTFNGYTGGADDNDAQGGHLVMAFTERTRAEGRTLEAQEDLAYALTNPGSGGRTQSRQIAGSFGVRRLTPRECERLQGFTDDFTAGQADAPRYRQLGNAVAVPVAEWLGRRIMEVQHVR